MISNTLDNRACNVPEAPVVPVPVDAVSVYVAPDPVTPVTAGDPVSPTGTSEKFPPPAATPVTGSLKVTVHDTDVKFVGEGLARLIESTVGAVRSISHVYAVAALVEEPDTARTSNVCDPAASGPAYDFEDGRVVPQSENEPPSKRHWNFVIAAESVYVNNADCTFVGFAGNTEIVGAGTGGAATATNAK